MKYGTLDAEGHPVYFTGTIYIDGRPVANPSREMCLAQGQKPFLDGAKPPAARSGMRYVRAGWTELRSAIVPKWRLVKDASPSPTAAFDYAIEEHLRRERAARGYTTREPDAYINSSVPRWAQDARDWVAHRDAVMGYALALMNQVEDGERAAPTMAEFKAGLPVIQWTYTEMT